MGCLPLADLHHFRLTKGFPKTSRLQCHLADWNAIWRYFASIRLCLALLFIISIGIKCELRKLWRFLKGFVPIVAQLDVEERESWVEQHTQEKMPEKIHTYSTIQLWAAPTAAPPPPRRHTVDRLRGNKKWPEIQIGAKWLFLFFFQGETIQQNIQQSNFVTSQSFIQLD